MIFPFWRDYLIVFCILFRILDLNSHCFFHFFENFLFLSPCFNPSEGIFIIVIVSSVVYIRFLCLNDDISNLADILSCCIKVFSSVFNVRTLFALFDVLFFENFYNPFLFLLKSSYLVIMPFMYCQFCILIITEFCFSEDYGNDFSLSFFFIFL